MIDLVALADVDAQAWRNGGGATRELLAWPSAADWRLRISVADIAADGPFSAFPGVARFFAVIEGAGVRLRFEPRVETLTPDSAPFAFDGGDAPHCELLDGATRDLNLMVRVDAGRGALHRAGAGAAWISAAPLRALFACSPVQLQIDDAAAVSLPARSLAWSAAAAGQRWRIATADTALRAWWIDFEDRT